MPDRYPWNPVPLLTIDPDMKKTLLPAFANTPVTVSGGCQEEVAASFFLTRTDAGHTVRTQFAQIQFTPTKSKLKTRGDIAMATLRNLVTVLFWGAMAAFLMFTQSAAGQKTTASPAIVFSASAEPSSFSCKNATCSGPAQFGFWIWCTAPSSTSNGDCRGSMFFHNIAPSAVQVTGTAALTGTTATITVSSATTAAVGVACTLVNNSLVSGRSNTVTVTCDATSWTKPGPSGASTTKADAIVKIINSPNETSSLQRSIDPERHQRASARLTLVSIDSETGRNAGSRG